MIRNAVNLGLIASDIDVGVLARTTAAVIATIDDWALEQSRDVRGFAVSIHAAELSTRPLADLCPLYRR